MMYDQIEFTVAHYFARILFEIPLESTFLSGSVDGIAAALHNQCTIGDYS